MKTAKQWHKEIPGVWLDNEQEQFIANIQADALRYAVKLCAYHGENIHITLQRIMSEAAALESNKEGV